MLLPPEVPKMMFAWQHVVIPLSRSSAHHMGMRALPGQPRARKGHQCLLQVGGRTLSGLLGKCFSPAESSVSLSCAQEKASVTRLQRTDRLWKPELIDQATLGRLTALGVRRGPVS